MTCEEIRGTDKSFCLVWREFGIENYLTASILATVLICAVVVALMWMSDKRWERKRKATTLND